MTYLTAADVASRLPRPSPADALDLAEPVCLWQWRSRPVDRDRRGELCQVLVRSTRMNSVLVRFADGREFVTSRNGLGRQVEACTRCGDWHSGDGDVCAGCDGRDG